MSDDLSPIMTYSESIADAEAVPPLPPSTYPAVISSVEIKRSKTTANRYAGLMLTIGPDHYPADYANIGPADGVKLSYNRLLVEDDPQSRYRLKKFFVMLGLEAPGREVDFTQLIGRECRVKTKTDTYEGELRAQVDAVLGPQ